MKHLTNYWIENQFKYNSIAQRLFLLKGLSAQYPATLNIEPTNFCNLRCSFCPIHTTRRPKGYLNLKLYQKIIDELSAEKKLSVLWLHKDGEPLLHPQIIELINYAKRKPVARRIELYSNGVLLTEKIGRELILAGLDSLVLSLDAIDRDSYKKLKQVDDYEQVVENLKRFLVTRKKIGKINPLLSVKTVDAGKLEIVAKFREQWKDIADSVVVQKLHDWEGSIKTHNPQITTQNSNRYPCNLPWLSPAITWDGKVSACCVNYQENELTMGDLNKDTLKQVWQSKKYEELRKAHLELDFTNYPTCRNCRFWLQLPNMKLWLKRING